MTKPVILALDDEADNLGFVQRALLNRYQVISFTKPQEALEYLKQQQPDLLLIDYKMPQMNGLEFLKQCRELGTDAAALMLTAFPDLSEVLYASQHGMIYKIVPKPIDSERLNDWTQLALMHTRMQRAEKK